MKKISIALPMLAALSFQGTAHAETGVTASVGTSGLGLHLSFPLKTSFNARVGVNGLTYKTDERADDVDYEFKLKLATVEALVDYFPMDGGFRISGGIAYNGSKAEASARPNSNGTYTFNGTTYAATTVGKVNGDFKFRKAAPYLGIGWGNAVAADKGWGFATDVGVLFQGSPKTTLSNSGCTASAAVCTQLASDIQAENRSFQDDVSDFKMQPILRVGISYKF